MGSKCSKSPNHGGAKRREKSLEVFSKSLSSSQSPYERMGFSSDYKNIFTEIVEREYISDQELHLAGFKNKSIQLNDTKKPEQGFKFIKKTLKTRVNDNLRLEKKRIAKKAANFFQEISVLERVHKLNCPQLFCQYEGAFFEYDTDSPEISNLEYLYKVGEFALADIIKTRGEGSWANNDSYKDLNSTELYNHGEIILFLKQILEALVILHENNIFLNEIRASNLYYNLNLKRYQICEFPYARFISTVPSERLETENKEIMGSNFLFNTPHEKYSSPEKIKLYELFRSKYNNKDKAEGPVELRIDPFKSDIYSLAMCLEEMLEGKSSKYKNINRFLEKMKEKDWKKRPNARSLLKEIDEIIVEFEILANFTFDEEKYVEVLNEKRNEHDDFSRIYKGMQENPTTFDEVKNAEAEYIRMSKRYQGIEERNLKLFINLRFKLGKVYTDIGEHMLALDQINRVMELEKIQYGGDETNIACSTLTEKVLVMGSLGDHLEALELSKRVLQIQINGDRKESNNDSTSYTRFIIAKQKAKLGNYSGAKEDMELILSSQLKQKHSDFSIGVAIVSCELAKLNFKLGNYSDSKEKCSNALTIISRIYKSNENMITSWILSQTARLNYKIGRHKMAEEQFDRVLRMKMKIFKNEEHLSVLETKQDIAKMWAYLGEESIAIDYLLSILNIRRKISMTNSNHFLISAMTQLAKMLALKGESAEALDYYNQIINNLNGVFPTGLHPLIATTFNNIGLHYVNRGDYTLALEYFGKSFNIRKTIFKSEQVPIVINTSVEIGRTFSLLDKFSEATETLRKCLEYHLKFYRKEEHMDISYVYIALAEHMEKMGGLQKAMEYYNKALKIQKEIFKTSDHPAVAFTTFAIGNLMGSMGDHVGALETFQQVEEMRKKIYRNHNIQGIVSINFARAQQLVNMKKYDEALVIFFEVIEARKKLYQGENNLLIASVYHELGLLYQKIYKFDMALKNLQTALEIEKIVLKTEFHPAIAATLHVIATVEAKLGNMSNAEEIFKKVIAIESKIYEDENHPSVRKSKHNMEIVLGKTK